MASSVWATQPAGFTRSECALDLTIGGFQTDLAPTARLIKPSSAVAVRRLAPFGFCSESRQQLRRILRGLRQMDRALQLSRHLHHSTSREHGRRLGGLRPRDSQIRELRQRVERSSWAWSNNGTPFSVTTGDSNASPPGLPATLTGLTSFWFNVPEPSALALAVLGAATTLIFRRRK
jgi:hypothetical protein